MSFSILSWNILGPATKDVENFGFIKRDYARLRQHLKIIDQYHADIICLQEVDLTTFNFFNEHLFENYRFAAYHEKGVHGGVVIYIKKLKFKLLHTVSSRLVSEQGSSPAAFCGIFLEHTQDEKPLFIANIHLSKSSQHQELQDGIFQLSQFCKLLKKKLSSQNIFMGDFNTFYVDMKEEVVPYLSEILKKRFKLFEHTSCTATKPNGASKSVDHFIYSGVHIDMDRSLVASGQYQHKDIDELMKRTEHEHSGKIYQDYPSDHAPIFVVVN